MAAGTPQAFGRGAIQALTDAATISGVDASLANAFGVTLGGNRTFAAFANPIPGLELTIYVKQDGTGSRTATWNANVAWASGTAPTLTTTAGATDVINFRWNEVLAKWIGTSTLNVS
jgi:hypothetical protein